MVACLREGGLKSLYDDIISAVDDFLVQWDPRMATSMEKECGVQGDYVSWSAYELFSQPLHI